MQTVLSFWCDLESFDKKVWPVTHFFRSADCLQFLMGLRKTPTKMCAQLHVFLLWRLSQVFDGTWKSFHKKVCPATRFFAVETISSFWWDLEKFSQKSVPSCMFLRCRDYVKFLMGLGTIFTKKCAQSQVSSLCRLSQVFDGTWKNFHEKVCPVTRFFAVETNLSFWCDLESFDKKVWPVTHFFSQCRLSSVFDGT